MGSDWENCEGCGKIFRVSYSQCCYFCNNYACEYCIFNGYELKKFIKYDENNKIIIPKDFRCNLCDGQKINEIEEINIEEINIEEINIEENEKYYYDIIELLENKNKEFNDNCEIQLAVMKLKLDFFVTDIIECNELCKEKIEQYKNELKNYQNKK